ncbi:putative adhesin [Escherichia coli]|uniref:Putative adhesin n=1 Tax=Escherichia coli TaxID=562 RepID=A0A376RAZ7_ECOLX|nr:putative adhesin [Escherichia coli]
MVVRQPAKPGLRLQMSETVTLGWQPPDRVSGLWDAQNGATTEEGAFALSRPLQAGAFNYTLNRDSDEDWYLRSENAYRAEVPLYTSMLTQAMDYDRILAGSRSHQTGVNGENNSVRLSIQGGHLGHDNNGGIARGATPESSGSYGFVRLEGDCSEQRLPVCL